MRFDWSKKVMVTYMSRWLKRDRIASRADSEWHLDVTEIEQG